MIFKFFINLTEKKLRKNILCASNSSMLDKRKFYINGKWVDPIKPNDLDVINPSTEETCAVISLGSKEDTNLAVSAAKVAFETWKDSSKDERINLLEKLLTIYKKRYGKWLMQFQLKWELPWIGQLMFKLLVVNLI